MNNECQIDKNLPTGREAEQHFAKFISKKFKVSYVSRERRDDYDLKLQNETKTITVEVKNDIASYAWGNLGFEYQQYEKNALYKKPSGFLITKADFWIHYYYEKHSWPIVGKYVTIDMNFLRQSLFNIMRVGKHYQFKPEAGDNGNDLIVINRYRAEKLFNELREKAKCTMYDLEAAEIKKLLPKTFCELKAIREKKSKKKKKLTETLNEPIKIFAQ